MRERLLNVALVIMGAAALATSGLVVRRVLLSPDRQAVVADGILIDNWQRYLADREPVGSPAAALTIIEFSDFQCPFCKEFADTLNRVRELYPDDVAVVYRHFPIEHHSHAYEAAMAAECAGAQGRYQEMRDLLFARQDSIGRLSWVDLAATAGVADQSHFNLCMETRWAAPQIAADMRDGRAIGMEVTPTSLINGVKTSGVVSVADLVEHIEAARRRKSE